MSANCAAVSPVSPPIPPVLLAIALAIRFGLPAPASTFLLNVAGVEPWHDAQDAA